MKKFYYVQIIIGSHCSLYESKLSFFDNGNSTFLYKRFDSIEDAQLCIENLVIEKKEDLLFSIQEYYAK